jgi:hypothetical protein
MKKITSIVLFSILTVTSCSKREDPLLANIRKEISLDEKWATEWKNLNFPKCKATSVAVEYDKFDKHTSFTTAYFEFGNDKICFFYSADGQVFAPPIPPREVSIFVYKENIYDFKFLIDGNVVKVEEEQFGIFQIPTTVLLDIVNAQKVECRLNASEFVLTKTQRKMFSDIVCSMTR